MLRSRVNQPGFYLMDEPDTPLSFIACLGLAALLHDLIRSGSQVIVATHSPIIAAVPGASILELGDWGIRAATWDELDMVSSWRRFLTEPDSYSATCSATDVLVLRQPGGLLQDPGREQGDSRCARRWRTQAGTGHLPIVSRQGAGLAAPAVPDVLAACRAVQQVGDPVREPINVGPSAPLRSSLQTRRELHGQDNENGRAAPVRAGQSRSLAP